MKYLLIVAVALAVIIALSYGIVILTSKRFILSSGKKVIMTVIISLLLSSVSVLCYLIPYQKADQDAVQWSKGNEEVVFSHRKLDGTDYLIFTNREKSDTVLIFYPGAKVDSASYLQLMSKTAELGCDIYIINPVFHLPVFSLNAPKTIIENREYDHVYLAGHSLGSVCASLYASSNPQGIDGLILLAGYPTKQLPENIRFLTIYGDRDGCLDMNGYAEGKHFWPSSSWEKIITGGNHSYFGQYGLQKGDNQTSIPAGKQIDITVEYIREFIGK